MRRTYIVIAAALMLGVTAKGFFWVRSARRDAVRAQVVGRLTWFHLVVLNYEHRHDALPPAFGPAGERNLSWHAFLLPVFEDDEYDAVYEKLDFGKPWNAAQNLNATKSSPSLDDDLSVGGYFICPLRDSKSIWNLDTGEPRGSLDDLPDAILFVAVPQRDIDPLQPYDVDENMLRGVLKQDKDVFFVKCNRLYGRVTLQDGRLVYTVPPYLLRGQNDP